MVIDCSLRNCVSIQVLLLNEDAQFLRPAHSLPAIRRSHLCLLFRVSAGFDHNHKCRFQIAITEFAAIQVLLHHCRDTFHSLFMCNSHFHLQV